MLLKRSGTYHFRRKVPPALCSVIGNREAVISLKTSQIREAQVKAGMLYAGVEKLFRRAEDGRLPEHFNLRNYLREMLDAHPSEHDSDGHSAAIAEIQRRFLVGAPESVVNGYLQHQDTVTASLRMQIEQLSNDVAAARLAGNPAREAELIANLVQRLQGVAPAPAVPAPAPTAVPESVVYDDAVQQFMAFKSKISPDTYKQMMTSLALFREVAGNRRMHEYSRKDASDFIEILRHMPNKYRQSASEQAMTMADIIARRRRIDPEYQTVNQKTLDRHMGVFRACWEYARSKSLMPRDEDLRIWEEQIVEDVRGKTTRRRSFSNAEFERLMLTPFGSRTNINTIRQIISVASFTGMRLEEIARLRPQDIETVDGVLCFRLQKHYDKHGKVEWDPKTEAGERIIPIHPYLRKETGIIERARSCERGRHPRIFHDLKPAIKTTDRGTQSSYGAYFGKQFGVWKTKAGLPPEVTFHSFRHTVRTIARHRNGGASYPVEWISQLMGHSREDDEAEGATYGEGTHAANLMTIVKTFRYDGWDPMRILHK